MDQDFHALQRKLLKAGKLFEDPDFKPSQETYGFEDFKEVAWMRPGEICKDARFELDGISRFNVKQGGLGDCWFLAALSSLAENSKLFRKVVPMYNDSDFSKDYAGIFLFYFWRFGEWVPIVIDDRLPTIYKQLRFTQAPKNEFWAPLLEKAYAKFYGSYGLIKDGSASEAMTDFTGGIIERYMRRFLRDPTNLFSVLEGSLKRGSVIGAGIGCKMSEEASDEYLKTYGLIDGHAYSVTGTANTKNDSGKTVKLVRVRNPWGETEWKGPFSANADEWKSIPEKTKADIKLTFDDNGEFFMPFAHFMSHFATVEICHISPNLADIEAENSKYWILKETHGKWIADDKHTPHVVVKLEVPDEDSEDGFCTMIVSLMQKNRRRLQLEYLSITFDIFWLDNVDEKSINTEFFTKSKAIGGVELCNYRQVCGRFRFLPGTYAIVPRTTLKGKEKSADFFLRVFKAKIGGVNGGKKLNMNSLKI